MKDKMFGVLQRVGRSFMLPIAILPAAGLLLGIGGSFTNDTMLKTYRLTRIFGEGTVFRAIFQVMSEAGNIVFTNLPILFAIGVAIGMAKKEKEVAALAAAIAFFVMHASISALITIYGGEEQMLEGATTSVCGITSLQMGVFGGIVVGLGVAFLHNRFYKIELPQVLSFFGGSRFVPIISAAVYTGVGILMFYIWPVIQNGIYAVGNVVLNSGYFGTWIYGLMERLLIPFGLHHVFYLPFWQTAVGGTLQVGGRLVEGAQNIFFAQLADPSVQKFAVSATRFMAGKFPLMIFGLPGAALAMYRTADTEKKKAAGGLLLSAALTSMLTGITEPLEFTFLFSAPLLYGIHCVFAGLAYMLMHLCRVGVGMTFSGGLIDMVLFGVLQGNEKTNWIWIVIVGIGYFAVYYLVFYALIRGLDLKTPGRDAEKEVKLYRRSDMETKKAEKSEEKQENSFLLSAAICRGLGGKENISDVDCCATRLRCTVNDAQKVDENRLKDTGASGVVFRGNGVQIIYGPRVTRIKSELEEYLETADEDFQEEERAWLKPTAESGKRTQESRKSEKLEQEREGCETLIVCSPLTGSADEMSHVPDEAFAQGLMGPGAAILPEDPMLRAPEDGEVSLVFDTKHALGFKTNSGISLLFHLGIDTVKLEGQGFQCFVQNGKKVKKGDALIRMDLEFLKAHAPSMVSPILCLDLEEHQKVRLLKTGKVEAGEPLLAIDCCAEN